jgi:simple sugar transport system ATP-binding protein
VASESIRLHERAIGHLDPAQRRALGLRYVPEERLGHAAVPGLTLAENVLLTGDTLHTGGLIRLDRARDLAARLLQRFDVRARGPAAPAESLSGGNLQKFIVGREIEAAPRVLLVNQPTWGVDVGAAARIRNELIALRAKGCAILVVSEDLDELYALCDRLLVIAKGRTSPAVAPSAIGVDEIGRWMAGLWPGANPA